MSVEEKIKVASERAKRLTQLLEAPEPGIASWWITLAETFKEFESDLISMGGNVSPKSYKHSTIEKIKSADINQQDWWWEIVENLPDQYAKGFLCATLERLMNVHGHHYKTEDFRDEFLKVVANYSIWKI